MKILNEFIPFPIQLLFLLGLAYSIYKFLKATSKSDKKNIVLKYLFYLIYFLLVQYFISPFNGTKTIAGILFVFFIIFICSIELYKIRTHLKLVHFIAVLIIFSGSILLFKFRQGMFELNIFYCVFIFDGMSQIGGQLLGMHKLSPKISPNKTWEGFFTGLIISLISMWFIDHHNDFIFIKNRYFSLFFYGLICVLALIGDLFFSKIKRISNIKDYGDYIPGHGGLLDRVDSLILLILLYFIFISLFLSFYYVHPMDHS